MTIKHLLLISCSLITLPLNASLEDAFTNIYKHKLWGAHQESVSGSGSALSTTEPLRKALPTLLKELNVRILLDAPCGDFNWMKEVNLDLDHYFGIDIVIDLARYNQRTYGTKKHTFIHADITKDPLPYADLILCRDCLAHLPYADIFAALKNFKSSGATYLLVSRNLNVTENADLGWAGGFRPLNLCKAPFNFPEPLLTIHEATSEEAHRSLGLWRLEDIMIK